MLTGNPVAGAGDKVEEDARTVSEDILEGRVLRRVVGDARDVKAKLPSIAANHVDGVAGVDVAQIPEHGRVSSGAVEVSIDDGAAALAGVRAVVVPAGIDPGALRGCGQLTVRENAH